MTLEEFLDEWHRQANEYGGSLTRDQRDIAEQAWLVATQQERETCAKVCEEHARESWDHEGGALVCADRIRARGEK